MTTRNTQFIDRKECYQHCKETNEKELGYPLKMKPGANEFHFTAVCKKCQAEVVSGRRSRTIKYDDIIHTFVLEDHGLEAPHLRPGTMVVCYPTIINGNRKSSLQELSQSEVLNVLVNDESGRRGNRKHSTSIQTKASLLACVGYDHVSSSAIKKASALLRITPNEHIQSYSAIYPYFEAWKKLNPTLAYDIEPKAGGVFERLVVVMPYTSHFLPNMLNVFGLDSSFMQKVPLSGLRHKVLQKLFGDPDLHPILSDRQYVLSKLTMTIVTGITLNHSRILLAYCLGYGENHQDTRFFLKFLLENGGAAINSAGKIIMSDRGACAGPVDEVVPFAIHHYCPKHLERNLQTAKYDSKIIDLFWEARCAKDETKYLSVMKRMELLGGRGKEAANYLRAIPKWQLYIIVAERAVLYELKSDNLVESMFAMFIEARCLASPVYAAIELAARAQDTISAAQEAVPEVGFLTPRAKQLSTKIYSEEAKLFVAEKVSTYQFRVWHAGSSKAKGKVWNVDVKNKTCSCHRWQQSGMPCCHAWRAFSPTQMLMEPQYYYEFCLLTRLRAMFVNYNAMSCVNMDDVADLQLLGEYPKLLPRTELIPRTGRSRKRIRSTGDPKTKGGATKSSRKKLQKTACPQCGKQIGVSNKVHAFSGPCFKYAARHKSGLIFENNLLQVYNNELCQNIDANVFDADANSCSDSHSDSDSDSDSDPETA